MKNEEKTPIGPTAPLTLRPLAGKEDGPRTGNLPLKQEKDMDVLKGIQEWFQKQCDGEWEHFRGITLESCDNPGWWLKIDLKGTNLENKKFKEIKIGDFSLNMPEPPWIHLYVENGVFNGAGDAMQLENVLRHFLDWARE